MTSVNDVVAEACWSMGQGPVAQKVLGLRTATSMLDLELPLTNPGLPADLIHVGDVLDLSLVATSPRGLPRNATVVLSREGKLVLFNHIYSALSFGRRMPDLSKYGIHIAEAGLQCQSGESGCVAGRYFASVTFAGNSASVSTGLTRQLGALSVTAHEIQGPLQVASCDIGSTVLMSGFMSP